MSTGSQIAHFTLKRLLSSTDLSTRFLHNLRSYVREHFAISYDTPCTFSSTTTPWALVSTADDTVTIEAQPTSATETRSCASDALGNLLRFPLPADADDLTIGQQKTITFPNELGTLYYIAIRRVDIPKGIRLNPRSGYPEYDYFVEAIGEENVPTDLVDNLDATMTVRVPSKAGHGLSLAGRKAILYRVNPAVGADSEGIAIASADIGYVGGFNVITTGYLGQVVPDPTLSAYRVVILGPSVDSVAFTGLEGWVEIGEVEGVGAGNAPNVFTTATQNSVDSSLVRATEYSGGPNWYDGTPNPATTVEAMLDSIITNLTGAFGSHKIRNANIDGASVGWATGEGYTNVSVGTVISEIVRRLGQRDLFAGGNDVIGVRQVLAPANNFGILGIASGGSLSSAMLTMLSNDVRAARVSLQGALTSWKRAHVYLGTDVGTPALDLCGFYTPGSTTDLRFVIGTFNSRAIAAVSAHYSNYVPLFIGGVGVTAAHNAGRGTSNNNLCVCVTDGGVGALYAATCPTLASYVAPSPGVTVTFSLVHTLTGSTVAAYFYLASTGGVDAILLGDNGQWATRVSSTWTARSQINGGAFTGRRAVYSSSIGLIFFGGNNGSNQCLIYSFNPSTPGTLTTLTPPTTDEMVDMASSSSGVLLLTRTATSGTLWLSTNGTTWTSIMTLNYRPTGMVTSTGLDSNSVIVGQYAGNQGSFVTYSADSFRVSGSGATTAHFFGDDETSSVRFDSGAATLYKPKDVRAVERCENGFVIFDQMPVRPGYDEHYGRMHYTPRTY